MHASIAPHRYLALVAPGQPPGCARCCARCVADTWRRRSITRTYVRSRGRAFALNQGRLATYTSTALDRNTLGDCGPAQGGCPGSLHNPDEQQTRLVSSASSRLVSSCGESGDTASNAGFKLYQTQRGAAPIEARAMVTASATSGGHDVAVEPTSNASNAGVTQFAPASPPSFGAHAIMDDGNDRVRAWGRRLAIAWPPVEGASRVRASCARGHAAAPGPPNLRLSTLTAFKRSPTVARWQSSGARRIRVCPERCTPIPGPRLADAWAILPVHREDGEWRACVLGSAKPSGLRTRTPVGLPAFGLHCSAGTFGLSVQRSTIRPQAQGPSP
ncbi:hypothetical protein C8Q79DRAFT_252002 [Trametes meyenii]|nr:hypothetical protein C8Q79DRAFT_252002 [Trametes meyenii]